MTTWRRGMPRCTSAVTSGAVKPTGTDGSRLHSAASRALMPMTDWMYWVVKKADPIIPKAATRFSTSAVVKPLDGYAGKGVFLLNDADPNTAVILETLTLEGRQPRR